MARKLIPMAIAYDFDGTLAPGNMQEYDFIPALDMNPKQFWAHVAQVSKKQDADPILMYMGEMLRKARAKEVAVRKEDFRNFGKSLGLFPGVDDWFDRVNAYGKHRGIRVEHFIISSGLREMIEGTKVFKKFRKVYASGFVFDENNVASWPALAINYTTKTQFLFRINKGSLDVHDNSVINKFVPMSERPVPFSNIVFIGDGETDIPCMRLVKDLGGHSIAVYNPNRYGAKRIAENLIKEGRATLSSAADYSHGLALELAVHAIIDKIEASNRIK